MSYEENVNAKELFPIRALAFALLQCRSEKEALQVIKYFATKPSIPAPSERDDQQDGAGAHWR